MNKLHYSTTKLTPLLRGTFHYTQGILYGRRLRIFIALIAVIQGGTRLNLLLGNGTQLIFSSDLGLGLCQGIFGILTLLTTNRRMRLGWLGRIPVVCLAAIFAIIAVAVLPNNTISGYTSVILCFGLLTEAMILGEC